MLNVSSTGLTLLLISVIIAWRQCVMKSVGSIGDTSVVTSRSIIEAAVAGRVGEAADITLGHSYGSQDGARFLGCNERKVRTPAVNVLEGKGRGNILDSNSKGRLLRTFEGTSNLPQSSVKKKKQGSEFEKKKQIAP